MYSADDAAHRDERAEQHEAGHADGSLEPKAQPVRQPLQVHTALAKPLLGEHVPDDDPLSTI
jgi:hypothetical protein